MPGSNMAWKVVGPAGWWHMHGTPRVWSNCHVGYWS